MASDLGFPLLRTKLNRPSVVGAIIARERLVQKLMPGLQRKLTVLSAPAGFGKTTILVQWLDSQTLPNAWLSLDENDDKFETFLAYVVEAIHSLFPGGCPNTLGLLYALRPVSEVHIAHMLINEIAALPQAFVLVLDDYHLVRSEAIQRLMATLITHAPHNLHLVISTRADPPLPLARLRARQELIELRAADLRFNRTETKAFLSDSMELSLDAQEVARLGDETEGWAVGLHLVALSLREVEDRQRLLDQLAHGEHGYVMDFLVNEVIAAGDPGLQEFLHWTSLFDRFSPALCDALGIVVAPYQRAEEVIAEIERSNLFVVRLDSAGEWFRYHHLFRSILNLRLRNRASQAEIREIHCRAIDWFASQGWAEEALEHALAAGEPIAAAEIVEQTVPELFNNEDWRSAERLLEKLPDGIIEQRPALLMAQAWTLVIRAQPEGLLPLLVKVEAELRAAPNSANVDAIEGQLCALRSTMLLDRESIGDEDKQLSEIMALAEKARQLLPRNFLVARRFALLTFGIAAQRAGQEEAALELLEQTVNTEGRSTNTLVEGAFIALNLLHANRGDLDAMERSMMRQSERRTRSRLLLSAAATSLERASFYYFRCRFAEAQAVLEDTVRMPWEARPGPFLQCGILLAIVHQLQDHSSEADEVLECLTGYVAKDGDANLKRILASATAKIAMLRGNIDIALTWAMEARPKRMQHSNEDVETPVLTYAATLIAEGTPASLGEANTLLLLLANESERLHFPRRRLQVLLLFALLQARRGEERTSLSTLYEAIELARPGRILVYFIEHGERMRHLLMRIVQITPGDGFVSELLAAFPVSASLQHRMPSTTSVGERNVHDLTQRESEALRLLEQGWSNAEIAEALVLSPMTVKRHIANLYQKLGVNNRTRAVRRGRELGLLPPA